MYSRTLDAPLLHLHIFARLQECENREVEVFLISLNTIPVGVSSAVQQTKCCCARRWKISLTSEIPSLSVLSVLW